MYLNTACLAFCKVKWNKVGIALTFPESRRMYIYIYIPTWSLGAQIMQII